MDKSTPIFHLSSVFQIQIFYNRYAENAFYEAA